MDERGTAGRLTVSAVAKRLGVAPATLRTWDRRYGLGPTEHPSGAHRRYGPGDLARLEVMRRLVLDGVPPAEAARVALSGAEQDAPTPDLQFPDNEGRLPRQAAPGGRVLSLPGAEDVVRGLARAAMSLDSDAAERVVGEQLRQHGVLRTWDQVLVPVLVAVGARWETTGDGVEVEHLLTACVSTALRRYAPHCEPGPRPVLLAGAPDDLHSLPLYALAAALAERGHASRSLGPAVPASALQAAVRRTGPAAVFVWSQTAATGDPSLLADLPVTRPPTALVVGGPGWPDALPPRISRAHDLGAALDLLGRAVSGQALASSG